MNIESAANTSSLQKLLLCDDHRLILDILTPVLRKEFLVLAVDNSRACLEAAETFQPHLAVLDVEMPGDADGFTTAQKLRHRQPALLLVFLSMHSGARYINRAVEVGAKAYIAKSAPAAELLLGLRAVADGQSLLNFSKHLSSSGMNGLSATGEPNHNARELLTPRQCEVLRFIGRGCSAKDIANELNISARTVEFHRAAIMQRLHLHSSAQLTRYALANDLG